MPRTNYWSVIAFPLICVLVAVALIAGNSTRAVADSRDETALPLDTDGSSLLPVAAIDPSAHAAASPPVSSTPAVGTLRLCIDFGDGFEKHFTALPASQGMTVADALNSARAHPRGIAFESTGSGSTLFIKSIDGQKNQSGASGNYWQFSINGVYGKRSAGIAPAAPGDTIRWTFGPYDASSREPGDGKPADPPASP